MKSFALHFFMFFFVACTSIKTCLADCDNLQDTCPAATPAKQTVFINGLPCQNPANVTAPDFKTNELSKAGSTDDIFGSSIKVVTATEFPGLNTLGLSIGRCDIDEDGVITPHYHPRATEMIFVTEGALCVGFLDTKNQLFQKFLKPGDVFVFPKGLFHFILNHGFETATVFSVYNSQNPGFVSISAKPFDTLLDSVDKLKSRLISLSASKLHEDTNLNLQGLDSIIYS